MFQAALDNMVENIENNDNFDSKEETRKKVTDYYLHEFLTVKEVKEKLDYSRSDLNLDEDADERTFALESLRQYHKDL